MDRLLLHTEGKNRCVLLGLLCGDSSFLGKHHRNVVANRIYATARQAFQPGIVRRDFDRRFADWTNENVQQLS